MSVWYTLSGLNLGGPEGAFASLKTGWPPWAMLCVLLLIIVTQNYVAMMTHHHEVHESFKNNNLKRFMNHMMSHHSNLIKIKFLH